METKWNFPSNGDGQMRGWNEAGIQTFTGNKTVALAREICQNSLDAASNVKPFVAVSFTRRKIKTKNIPGYAKFKKVLTACKNYWSDNQNTKNYLDRALSELNSETTFVIRASDFIKTVGLVSVGASFFGAENFTDKKVFTEPEETRKFFLA